MKQVKQLRTPDGLRPQISRFFWLLAQMCFS
jgi:hypothetical protein